MQDAIIEFQAAPLWAQIAMVLFATAAVVSLVEPSLRRWRFRRRFDAIARGLGQAPPVNRGWPVAFSVSVDGRGFKVRHDLRSTSSGSSYRGPSGHLLITATQLAGTRWSMHQVDVRELGRVGAWIMGSKARTGDADFDARFVVIEDGLPARDGWLDPATRRSIVQFFDGAPLPGVIWIREGELQFTMANPWKDIDGAAVRALLQRQGALAAALDATATARF